MAVHIFVPRWMNSSITNAQNSNARALLSRFTDPRAHWTAVGTDQIPEAVTRNDIHVVQLHRSRLWKYQLALKYLSSFDAIFYPGVDWPDEFGLKARRLLGKRAPVIATIEGIIADAPDVARLSNLVGHPVFSQPGVEHAIPRIRSMYQMADHIIAISPFLAQGATFLYGNKVSFLPLGVDRSVFFATGRQEPSRCRVVGCGTVKSSKNPEMFLELASRYPEADFIWYGDGPMVASLSAQSRQRKLANLSFPGGLQPAHLAEEFRKSSLFVLPSHAEGVPKVVQEAAACGLPIVVNGYYVTPSVEHMRNGLVAWSDEELIAHVGTLIHDPGLRRSMGAQSVEMAKEWDWDRIAPQWQDLIIRLVRP